jgi:four helix bundle protein
MEGLAPAKSFEDLIVWQRAHRLVLEVYRVTGTFPRHETYGLVAQLQRAAVSVPANVAEGFRRRGKADKLRFLNIAQGSLAESRYYLLLAQDLGATRKQTPSRRTSRKSAASWIPTPRRFSLLSAEFCVLNSVFCVLLK